MQSRAPSASKLRGLNHPRRDCRELCYRTLMCVAVLNCCPAIPYTRLYGNWRKMGCMTRALTAKQTAFVRLVSQGYQKRKGAITGVPPRTTEPGDSQNGGVSAEQTTKSGRRDQRLVVEQFPETLDPKQLADHAVAVMAMLSTSGSEWRDCALQYGWRNTRKRPGAGKGYEVRNAKRDHRADGLVPQGLASRAGRIVCNEVN